MDISFNELCYTTRTGIRIGASYARNQTTIMSPNDIFWQGVLLGIEPAWSRRRTFRFAAYVMACVILFLCMKGMTND